MVQDDIDGRRFDISGKSFLQGMLDPDNEKVKLEAEVNSLKSQLTNSPLLHTRGKSWPGRQAGFVNWELSTGDTHIVNWEYALSIH